MREGPCRVHILEACITTFFFKMVEAFMYMRYVGNSMHAAEEPCKARSLCCHNVPSTAMQ